ncbi:MAG: hypothetical protein ABTQ73_09055 [Caldilineales bacterium]
MKQLPSPWRIAQTDYMASLGAILILIIWGMALVARFFDPSLAEFLLKAAPVATVIGLVLLLWRIQMIRGVFERGSEVAGVVSSASFFRGRGRIAYTYTHQSQKYISSNALQANKITRNLPTGTAVTVMVHGDNPKHAFLREIYLPSEVGRKDNMP